MGKFFESYKNRKIIPGQQVEIYRNLNKPGITYSVRDAKTGLVLGHASSLLLSRCKFIVNQRGRDKVVRTKRKSVHAWISGSFCVIHAGDDKYFGNGTMVSYNPYTNLYFELAESGEPVIGASLIYIQEGVVNASNIIRLYGN